ncbi:MAG: SCO family protein [Nitrospirae bacterium]|nr:MAG: SCO family protein [Nitrospirota bacterium]
MDPGRYSLRAGLCLIVLTAFLCSAAPAAARQDYTRTTPAYAAPEVTLVNQHGAKVPLRSLLQSGKPVMFDFIFTTCTTICPFLSASYTNFQRTMGPEANKVHLVSISIDPENDTPKKMKEYLGKFDAREGWDFLTGSRSDIDKVIRAFDTGASNKMSHLPIIIIWSPAGRSWTRISGLISTSELIKEYRKAVAK